MRFALKRTKPFKYFDAQKQKLRLILNSRNRFPVLQHGIATNVPELKIKLIIFEENFMIRLKFKSIKRGASL